MIDTQFNNSNSVIENIPSTEKTNFKKILIIIIAIALFIGGGAFAYHTLYTSPTKILEKSLQNSSKVRSISFNSTSTTKIINESETEMPTISNFSLLSGSIDFNSIEKLAFDIDISNISKTEPETGDNSLTIGLKTIFTQKNLYFNLKDLNVKYDSSDSEGIDTVGMILGMVETFAKSLQNKWIVIDTTDAINTHSSKNSLDENEMQMIRDYVTEMSYIKNIEKVGDDKINDIETYHLKVTMQHDQKLVDIIKKITSEEDQTVNVDDYSQILNQKIDLDLWIEKKDYMIYKIVTSPVSVNDSNTGNKAISSQEITFSNHNQPITVSAPEDTITFEELMVNMFEGMALDTAE